MSPKEKMDAARGPTIALPTPSTTTQHYYSQRHLSRSSSRESSEVDLPTTGMAIPGARRDHVPPALPPPRYNNNLDHGVDLAWQWQNEHLMAGRTKLAPIKPGSSLLGIPARTQLIRDDDQGVGVDSSIDHSQSSVRAVASPSRSRVTTAASIPSLVATSPPASGINQT